MKCCVVLRRRSQAGNKKAKRRIKASPLFPFFEKRQGDVFDYHEHVDVYAAEMYFITQILLFEV